MIATGRREALSRSVWYEIEVGGVTGWASSAYLAPMSRSSFGERILERLGSGTFYDTAYDLSDAVQDAITALEPTATHTVRFAARLGQFRVPRAGPWRLDGDR